MTWEQLILDIEATGAIYIATEETATHKVGVFNTTNYSNFESCQALFNQYAIDNAKIIIGLSYSLAISKYSFIVTL